MAAGGFSSSYSCVSMDGDNLCLRCCISYFPPCCSEKEGRKEEREEGRQETRKQGANKRAGLWLGFKVLSILAGRHYGGA